MQPDVLPHLAFKLALARRVLQHEVPQRQPLRRRQRAVEISFHEHGKLGRIHGATSSSMPSRSSSRIRKSVTATHVSVRFKS